MSRHISWIRIRHRQSKDWWMRRFPRNEIKNCHHEERSMSSGSWLAPPITTLCLGWWLCKKKLCTAWCSLSASKETPVCAPLSGISPGLLLCVVAPWNTSGVLSFPLFLEPLKLSCLETHSRTRYSNYPISAKLPTEMNPGHLPFPSTLHGHVSPLK